MDEGAEGERVEDLRVAVPPEDLDRLPDQGDRSLGLSRQPGDLRERLQAEGIAGVLGTVEGTSMVEALAERPLGTVEVPVELEHLAQVEEIGQAIPLPPVSGQV